MDIWHSASNIKYIEHFFYDMHPQSIFSANMLHSTTLTNDVPLHKILIITPLPSINPLIQHIFPSIDE